MPRTLRQFKCKTRSNLPRMVGVISRVSRQSGQALPLGIAFALVGVMGAFVLFNTGQVAVNKQRLSDAADSAAYSGLVWQARALNFQAYTNRAMIANDVSIGQAVSLNSWSHYAANASGNIAEVLKPVPVINAIAAAVSTVFLTAQKIVEPVAGAMVLIIDKVNAIIELSQDAMFTSAFIATPDIVKSVADGSDERFEALTLYSVAGLADNLTQWKDFTEKYEHDDMDAMRERTALISDSRDRFATDRRWKFIKGFWFYTTPLTKHRVFYEGQTRLMMTQSGSGEPTWEWVAKDTMSLQNKTKYFKRWKIRTRTDELPIGWAAAYANEGGSSSGALGNCESYTTHAAAPCTFMATNGRGEDWATRGVPGISSTGGYEQGPFGLSNYTGVREFRSISEAMRTVDGGDPVLRLRTEVSMDIEQTSTSSTWVGEGAAVSSELAAAADKISSISIAEVYYRHPKAYRTSNNTISMQRANGYNPYWDVRLVPVEMTERLVALALRGGTGSSASTPGTTQLPDYDDEGGDLDIGGNLPGDLPAYAGELAAAMGLEDVAMDQAGRLYDRYVGVGSIEGFTALASEDAIKQIIEDELKEEIEDAVVNLLRSFFEDQLGVDRAEQDAWIQTAEEIEAEAEEFNRKMEAIQEKVAEEFDAAIGEEFEAYQVWIDAREQEVQALRDEITEVRNGSYNEEYTEDKVQALNNQIQSIRDTYADRREQLNVLMVDVVLDSMLRHGGEFFPEGLPRVMFEESVRALVATYLGQNEDERDEGLGDEVLDWGDEENGDEPTVDVGDNYGGFED